MMRPMSHSLPGSLPENAGVLRYLGEGADPADVPVERPTATTDRWHLGAHPDIVERLWTDLAGPLPDGSQRLIAGGAALVDPSTGLVLAVALGTSYALRLDGDGLREARARGYVSLHEFTTVGRTLDLEATFGRGWVFGRHEADEGPWLASGLAERTG